MYQENGCGPVILIEAEWKFYESEVFFDGQLYSVVLLRN